MTPRRILRTAGILLGYGALFYLFDTQATFFEVAPGVSLWYPSAGLNLALVLIFGVKYTPAIFAAGFVAGLWISDPAIPLSHLLLPVLLIATGNGLAAWWLRWMLRTRTLFSPGAIARVVGVTAGLAAWNSVLSVGSYLLTGLEGYTLHTAPSMVSSWWLADWAGMLTLTPPLVIGALILGPPDALRAWRQHEELHWPRTPRALLELCAEVGAVGLSLYGTFYLYGTPYLFYLCFLPLLWMALRHGLPRSATGVLLINLGAVAALHGRGDLAAILQLQLFIVVLALTGLFLGALVSERKRAFRTLQQALRTPAAAPNRSAPSSRATARTSFDDDPALVADRLRKKQKQLAESARTLRSQNRQLRSSEAVLKRQNERKDQLFSIIAHDLKNHIGSAAGLTELLAEQAHTMERDDIAEFAHHLNRSTWEASNLLDSLLEWAHMYVGDAAANRSELEAASLVEAALQHVAPDAAQKNITLEQDIERALTVHGHSALLQSVVRNLVANAVKFTAPGGSVAIRARSSDGGVAFCVHDDGIGIPDEMLDRLFQPLAHRPRPGTDNEQGAGLGLALCREIVERHGGSIEVESEPGEGSVFRFTIPPASQQPG